MEVRVETGKAQASINGLTAAYDKQTVRLGKTILAYQTLDAKSVKLSAAYEAQTVTLGKTLLAYQALEKAHTKLGASYDAQTAKLGKSIVANQNLEQANNRLGVSYEAQTTRLGKALLANQALSKANTALTARVKVLTAENASLTKTLVAGSAAHKKMAQATMSHASSLSLISTSTSTYSKVVTAAASSVTRLYNSTSFLAAGTTKLAAAIKKAAIDIQAKEVATQKLNASFAKLVGLEADILLLTNAGHKALLKEIAAKEILLGVNTKFNTAQARANTLLNTTHVLFTKLTTATNTAAVATQAEAIATEKLSASYAKLVGLEADIILLRSKKNKSILAEIAAKERLLGTNVKFNTAQARARTLLGATRAEFVKLTAVTNANAYANKHLATSIKKATAARAKANVMLRATYVEAQKLYVVQGKVAASTAKLTASTAANTLAMQNQRSAIRGVAGALGGLWLAYGNIVPMMLAFMGAMVVKDMVVAGAQFQYLTQYIDALGQASGQSDVELGKLRETLLGFEDLRKGPQELAAGMREFAKAGVSTSAAMADIAEMARFATVAEIDMATATSLVIGQANAFGETYSDAANMITAAAMSSATSITEMAQAMSQTTELGSVSKMRFHEVAAALAAMANAGIRGTKAGTSIRTSIIRLQTPTSKAAKMMRDLGVSFSAFHSDGSAKGMVELFEELEGKLAGLADKERITILRELFGLRAMKGGANILRVINQGFADMVDYVDDAAEGVTLLQKTYAELDDTTVAKWERLQVAYEKFVLAAKTSIVADAIIAGAELFLTAANKFIAAYEAIMTHTPFGYILLKEMEHYEEGLTNVGGKLRTLKEERNALTTELMNNLTVETDLMTLEGDLSEQQIAHINDRLALINEEILLLEAEATQIKHVASVIKENLTDNWNLATAAAKAHADEIKRAVDYTSFWDGDFEIDLRLPKIDTAAASFFDSLDKVAFAGPEGFAKGFEAEEKALAKLTKARETADEKQLALGLKTVSDRIAENKRLDAADEKILKAGLARVKKRVDEQLRQEKKFAKEKKDIKDDLRNDIREMTLSEYDYQVWALEENITLWQSYVGKDAEMQDMITEYRKLKMEEFSNMHNLTLADMQDQWKDFTDGAEDEFAGTLSSMIKGEIRNLEDAWKSFTDNLLDMFVDMISEMIAKWVASGLIGMLNGEGFGGFAVSGIAGLFGGSSSTGSSGPGAGQGLGIAGSAAGLGYEMATGESLTSSIGSYIGSTETGVAIKAWWAGLSEEVGAEVAAEIASTGIGSLGPGAGQGMTTGLSGVGGPGAGQGMTIGANSVVISTGSSGVSGVGAGGYGISAPSGAGASGLGSGAGAGAGGMSGAAALGPIAALAAFAYFGLKNDIQIPNTDYFNMIGSPEQMTQRGNMMEGMGVDTGLQGVRDNFTSVSEIFRLVGDDLSELQFRLQSVDQASLNTAEGVMVLKNSAEELDYGIREASYNMYTFDEATQAWSDQSGAFDKMLGTMQEMGPLTDDAVLSTAAYLTEMKGIPSVTDELVSAYNEVAGTTAVATGSVEASTQAYTEAMYGVTLSNKEAISITRQLSAVKSNDVEDTRHLTDSLRSMGLSQQEAASATQDLLDVYGPLASETAVLAGAVETMGTSFTRAADRANAAAGSNDRGGYVPTTTATPGANTNYRASGGDTSGWTMMGEQGRELVYMPPSRVYSAPDTKDILAQNNRPIHITLVSKMHLDGQEIDERVDTIIVDREERGAVGKVIYR